MDSSLATPHNGHNHGAHLQHTPTGLRFVTVAFCDIADSTQLATSLSAEVWHNILDRYFNEVRNVLEAHGGQVEKFIGDAVVGVFGINRSDDTGATHAVQAALHGIERMRKPDTYLRRRRLRLSIRFGIASGYAVLTARDSSFAIGAVMNCAARLQSAAPPSGVLIDVRTWLLLRDSIPCEAVGPIIAKGFPDPIPAWQVIGGTRQNPARLRSAPQPGLLHEVLAEAVARLQTPGRSVIILEGEIGIGKTTLLYQLHEALAAKGVPVVFLRCKRDDPPLGTGRLHELEELLSACLGSTGSKNQRARRSATGLRAQITRSLAALSLQRPTVVLIDDAHWADNHLLATVRADPGNCGPFLFVIAGRAAPDRMPPGTRVFPVPPLTDEDSRYIFSRLLDDDVEAHAHHLEADSVVQRSGGNPLFLEQLAALTHYGIEDLVPPSASTALIASIDNLGASARRVLNCLGAWGTTVARVDLAATCGLSFPQLTSILAELDAKHLNPVPTSTDNSQINCTVAARVAYAHLPLADRAALHTTIATYLHDQDVAPRAMCDLAAVQSEQALRLIHEVNPRSAQERTAARLAIACSLAAARSAPRK